MIDGARAGLFPIFSSWIVSASTRNSDHVTIESSIGMSTKEMQEFSGEQPRRLLKQLAFEIHRTIRSSDAGAVHDLRVVIRRFFQALVACKPFFPGREMPKSRRRLKKIMDTAGQVRNLDVALEFVAKWRVPQAVRLHSKLDRHRKELSRILVLELRRGAGGQTLLRWQVLFAAAPAAGLQETAQQTVRRLGTTFLKAAKEAASPKATPEDLHRLRIAAKKLRYTLELFPASYGSSFNSGLASIKRVHRLLGAINDCATAAAIVAEYRGGRRLALRLEKRQHNKSREFRQYWSEELQEGKQLEGWIDRLERATAQPRRIKRLAA